MATRDNVLVSRTLYQIGVITLIASVLWVGVGIYSISGQEFKTQIDPAILEPITPNLDEEVIKAMSGRLKIEGDLTSPPEAAPEDLVAPQTSTVGAQQSGTIEVGQ